MWFFDSETILQFSKSRSNFKNNIKINDDFFEYDILQLNFDDALLKLQNYHHKYLLRILKKVKFTSEEHLQHISDELIYNDLYYFEDSFIFKYDEFEICNIFDAINNIYPVKKYIPYFTKIGIWKNFYFKNIN